ncbi:DDE family transposase [Deinococcus yavapaiensis KR-236]|uniref:DDE family transposase n=1 Tax=Deinococcus yavapaiensis KR-236 TaxID=694435 RepID=A0A318RZX6_9DEIO|nr:DDE family transposase [Deinococcus yavapaiensis KR-236]
MIYTTNTTESSNLSLRKLIKGRDTCTSDAAVIKLLTLVEVEREQTAYLLRGNSSFSERNRVERLVGQLKHFRRVATRYEKRAATFLGMLTFAAILLWLK